MKIQGLTKSKESHQIMGINYFREKLTALAVAAAIVLLTMWFTKDEKVAVVADRDNDGILDSVDICPDEKGELRYGGCLPKANPVPKDFDSKNPTPKQGDIPTSELNPESGYYVGGSHSDEGSHFDGGSHGGSDWGDSHEEDLSSNPTFTNPGPPNIEVTTQPISVDCAITFQKKTNVYSWSPSLADANNLTLEIIPSDGSRGWTIDVTGKSSYEFSPNKGNIQGMKMSAILSSSDKGYSLDNRRLENHYVNCSN
jgi:hypothetical protein